MALQQVDYCAGRSHVGKTITHSPELHVTQDAALTPEPLALQRMTTEFDEYHDRLRLVGEVASGEPLVLWVTQRMLKRVIPHMVQWLQPASEGAGPDYHQEAVQSFAQQAAVAQLAPQAPVQAPAPAQLQAGSQWLIDSVDLVRHPEVLGLVFKCGELKASLVLGQQDLRQWLAILHLLCTKAEWSMDVWPEWIAESAPGEVRWVQATVH